MSTYDILSNFADRVWFAWQCLPRDERGNLPTWKALELEAGLPYATFYRVQNGVHEEVKTPTLQKLSVALRCTPEWLSKGRGHPPVAQNYVRPRPIPFFAGPEDRLCSELEGWEVAEEEARIAYRGRVPEYAFQLARSFLLDPTAARPAIAEDVYTIARASMFSAKPAACIEAQRRETEEQKNRLRRDQARRSGHVRLKG